eukprot:6979357-Karenia_brevis.AAC.1
MCGYKAFGLATCFGHECDLPVTGVPPALGSAEVARAVGNKGTARLPRAAWDTGCALAADVGGGALFAEWEAAPGTDTTHDHVLESEAPFQ